MWCALDGTAYWGAMDARGLDRPSKGHRRHDGGEPPCQRRLASPRGATVSAAGMSIAPWLRSRVCQVTTTDFPARWQGTTSEERSYDSRIYNTRLMLRPDETSQTKVQQLMQQFGTSKANIVCQPMPQATPEDFPTSWHMRTAERRAP